MIKPGEIQNKAGAVGVRDQQIEKDYVLSWILQGIALLVKIFWWYSAKSATIFKFKSKRGYVRDERLVHSNPHSS